MTVTPGQRASTRNPSAAVRSSSTTAGALLSAGPPLLFGLRLWASVCLALYVAFWLQLDNAYWAGTSAAFVCQPRLGASLRKGWYRLVGTLTGAVAIVALTASMPQDRLGFLVALTLWCAACAVAATVLHNFASYAAALAGFTAVIIASDDIGAVGGPHGQVFMLAVTRATEICIGIVCAGIVLAGTDFGGARRGLAVTVATLTAAIAARFVGMLVLAGPYMPETMPARRELLRRVIALDPIIDQAKGESSQLRYHSPILQATVDGLFIALAGWRSVAVLLARMPKDRARREARILVEALPHAFRSAARAAPTRWIGDAFLYRTIFEAAAKISSAVPAGAPSLRLLADQTAMVFSGISEALNGLALLVAMPAERAPRRGPELRVPDWLPALVNAARVSVLLGAVELFWITSAWPNGSAAITFAAIVVLVFTPRSDRPYEHAAGFVIGTVLAALFAAIFKFAVLPRLESYEAFMLALGIYFVPVGTLMAWPWQARTLIGMATMFVPFLSPANQMTYDTEQFYNAALAILTGAAGAALSFLLVPPLSPSLRTRRLLQLSLDDLRRLSKSTASWSPERWAGRIYGRLAVMPEEAEAVERARLLAALSVGTEILRLRDAAPQLGLGPSLGTALDALARADYTFAAARLADLDRRLASRPGHEPEAVSRARASILAICEALDEHASYFDAGPSR